MRAAAFLIVLFGAACVEIAAASAAPAHTEWGAFGYSVSSLFGADVDVKIERSDREWAFIRTDHRVRTDERGGTQEFDVIRYADQSSCPAIAARMALLSTLDMPHIDMPAAANKNGRTEIFRMILHGTNTYLDAPMTYRDNVYASRRARLENYAEGSVYDWVMGTMKAVDGCWTDKAGEP